MHYSKSTGGFYSRDIHGDRIPSGSVEITAEYHQALLIGQSAGKRIVADSKGYPVLKDAPVAPPQAPSSVTMRQARLALHASGLLQSVEDSIDAMPEPSRTTARIEWDYASRVERSSQFVAMLGTAIGLDDAQMDELFMAASIL